jgi:hypothetical protein
VILVWISNPFTMPAIFYWNYRVALFISGSSKVEVPTNYNLDWWLNNIFRLWEEVMVGGLILGLLAGATGFLVTRLIWRLSVIRTWRHRQLRLKLRKRRGHS